MKRLIVLILFSLSSSMPAQSPTAFQKAWVSQTGDWNKGVAVAPSGDVISLAAGRLRVHARDTGQVLDSIPIGYVLKNAWAFVGNSVVLVGDDQIFQVTLPGGAKQDLVKLDARANVGCVSSFGAAVASEKGLVQVFSAKDWKLFDTFEAGGPVEGLALGSDGKTAVSLSDGTMLVRNPAIQKTAVLFKREGSGSTAVALSSDGKRLFAPSGTFKTSLWDLSKWSLLAEYSTGSWLTAVRFMNGDVVAAAGSDGLVLYEKPGDPSQTLAYSSGRFAPSVEGLAVSPDGAVICSGDRDGIIACFARGPLKPSEYKPQAAAAQGPNTAGQGGPQQAPAKEVELTGTLVSRSGQSVSVKLDQGSGPSAGAQGTLYKRFEKEIAGFKTSGWLEIAAVQVKKSSGPVLELTILEKRSVMTVNGKEVDHFIPGVAVKLALGTPAP